MRFQSPSEALTIEASLQERLFWEAFGKKRLGLSNGDCGKLSEIWKWKRFIGGAGIIN